MQNREQVIKPSTPVLICSLALGVLLAGCSNDEVIAKKPEEKADVTIPVEWKRLADNSYGWFETDAGFHGERCWKDATGYRCIQVLRFKPLDENAVNIEIDDTPTNFYARRATTLDNFKIYPESGYSCKLDGGAVEEAVTLPNGAIINNRIDEGSKTVWTSKYVRNFYATNSPRAPGIVHFDCLALVSFLKQANEKALLTTALAENVVFPIE